jgi:hypothetical protein
MLTTTDRPIWRSGRSTPRRRRILVWEQHGRANPRAVFVRDAADAKGSRAGAQSDENNRCDTKATRHSRLHGQLAVPLIVDRDVCPFPAHLLVTHVA